MKKPSLGLLALTVALGGIVQAAPPLGLPPVPIPADNPQTPAKVALGEKPFHDKRFSSTGEIACASCHEAAKAFTDSEFHNVGVGINQIQDEVPPLAQAFLKAKAEGANVDESALTDPKVSELGRFAVTDDLSTVGAIKTPTLRNIAETAPYMHDGSLETLRDVVVHYNLGGKSEESQKVNPYLSGGVRPLDLSEQEIDDLVAFMEALTSPEYAKP